MLAEFLKQTGATVCTAASARYALEQMQLHGPDILISDISMPDMDGYDLLNEIRALGPDKGGSVPAIAVTACSEPEFRVKALRSGFTAYLLKPLDLGDLIETAQKLIFG